MARDVQHLGDLTPDPRNARRHNPRNVGLIEDALREVGAGRSIVIDEHGTVLAGNATIEAAAAAGIERVQVVDADGRTIIAVRRSGLSDHQKQRLALYDNRAAELADWDPGVLLALQEEDARLMAGLWTGDEIDALLARPIVPEATEQAEPQLPAECLIEIYCSRADLDDFRATLNDWSARHGVTLNIS